jgi:hypothetical protein
MSTTNQRTFADLLTMDFPYRPVFDGLLDQEEILLVAAPSNLGKSMLTTNSVLAAALGQGDLLGTWPIFRALKTLIIQAENPARAVQKRIQAMITGYPEWGGVLDRVTELIDPASGRQPTGSLTNPLFREQVVEAARSFNAGLILWDPLICYHHEDENANKPMANVMECIHEVNHEAGTSAIVVHHFGKTGNSPRGAQAIYDRSDNILIMESDGYQPAPDGHTLLPKVKLTLEKSRNYPKGTTVFAHMDENLIFSKLDDGSAQTKMERQALVRDVLAGLGGSVGAQKDLLAAVRAEMVNRGQKRLGASSLKALIRDTLEAGLIIEQTAPGKKSKGLALPNEVIA